MERIYLKLQVLKGETLSELNEQFRRKVQLEEERAENEVKLQFNRGRMQAFDEVQHILKNMRKADELEAVKARRAELSRVPTPSGDGDKEPTKEHEVKTL